MDKKNKKHILRWLAASMCAFTVTSLTGCAEEVSNLFGGNRGEVEVTASFNEPGKAVTRAHDGLNSTSGFTLTTEDNSESKVRVMVDQNDGDYSQFDYNVTGATTINRDSKPTFPSGESSVNVYGWYPARSLTNFTVAADQTGNSGYCLSDLLFANGTTCVRNISTGAITSAANLSFSHVMAKVKVNLTLATGVTVKSATFKQILPQVTVTETKSANVVTDYSVGSAGGSATDITLLTGGSLTSASDAADLKLCGVFPDQSKNGAFLVITASYNSGSDETITYSFDAAKHFVGGNEYTMNISLDGTNVTTGTVTLTGWNVESGIVNIGGGGGGTLTLDNTSANLTYDGSNGTVTVTETGSVTGITASSANTGIATASASGTTVTISPVAAGSTQVLVYGVKGGNMLSSVVNVTVAKAAGAINSFSPTSLTIGGVGNTGSFTVDRAGDGAITATSSDTDVATVAVSGTTVTVTNVSEGNATITVKVGEGTNHLAYTANDKTVAVTCNAMDMHTNPLWWVAQYNMDQNKTSFVSSHATSPNQYCFNFTDAATENIADYHLPSRAEQTSIIPCNTIAAADGSGYINCNNGDNIFSKTGTTTFSEVACNVGGNSVAASTSVIKKNADNDYYAIRFIGTSYCSAWHYKWVASPCNGLLIESYLLSGVTTVDAATTLINGASFNSTTFQNAYVASGSSSVNVSPASTTVTTNGYCQRFLPACGYCDGATGAATNHQGSNGIYWSATAKDSSYGWYWLFGSGNLLEYPSSRANGFSVRLFRDH